MSKSQQDQQPQKDTQSNNGSTSLSNSKNEFDGQGQIQKNKLFLFTNEQPNEWPQWSITHKQKSKQINIKQNKKNERDIRGKEFLIEMDQILETEYKFMFSRGMRSLAVQKAQRQSEIIIKKSYLSEIANKVKGLFK